MSVPPAHRPLRIAVCVAYFHPIVGGAERQMFQLAERWARWGHQPVVFTRRLPGQAARESLAGIEIRRCIRTLSLGPLFGATFIASLAAQLVAARRRYDVLLAAQLPWEAVATGLVSRRLGKPAVAVPASTGPGGDVDQILKARGATLLRRCVLANQRFLALSEQTLDELRQLGCPETLMARITNGVDLQRFCPTDDGSPQRERTVCFVARLVPAKNPHVLLRAWARLNAGGTYRLLIAGDGPLGAELRSAAEAAGLRNVEFLGPCDDVPAVHRRASVYVLPSPSEGCSNALLEAMASGLCPVVSRVPGNVDLVRHEQTGLLFPHDDDQALAAALDRVLQDAALRRRLAAAARAHVEAHHDLDRIARRFVEEFELLTAAKPPRGDRDDRP
jgi:glycosyltransferase involved in cell wall biosynthesis